MYSLLAALCTAFHPTPTVAVAFAGDSVIVTVSVADNAVAQTVSVDSVKVTVQLTPIANSSKTQTLPHAAPTVFRFAYPLSLWAPGQTLGGPIDIRLGHIGAGCAPSACWSGIYTKGSAGAWAWGYLLDNRAPNPAEPGAVTVPSVGLN